MCTKFDVDSSSGFSFRAPTHRHTTKVADTTDHSNHALATAGVSNKAMFQGINTPPHHHLNVTSVSETIIIYRKTRHYSNVESTEDSKDRQPATKT